MCFACFWPTLIDNLLLAQDPGSHKRAELLHLEIPIVVSGYVCVMKVLKRLLTTRHDSRCTMSTVETAFEIPLLMCSLPYHLTAYLTVTQTIKNGQGYCWFSLLRVMMQRFLEDCLVRELRKRCFNRFLAFYVSHLPIHSLVLEDGDWLLSCFFWGLALRCEALEPLKPTIWLICWLKILDL